MRVRPADPPHHTLAEVAAHLGVGRRTTATSTLTGISLNTALVEPGDLYAALPGSRSHGADHAAAALDAGAVAVLTDADGAGRVEALDVPTLVVEEPRALLADLSAWFYGHPSDAFTTIGVTGTQGKTTTTYLAEAALGARRSAVVGTIGTRIAGVPAASALTTPEAPALQALFAVMREEDVEVCVMEVSSHAMVQGRVDGFVFDVAVFLNLGRDHLDFHRDLDEYFLAKAALFTPEHARQAVVNVDDAHGRRLLDLTPLPVTTFSSEGQPGRLAGREHPSAPARHRPAGARAGGGGDRARRCRCRASSTSPTPWPSWPRSPRPGSTPAELAAGIAASTGVPGRMERVEAGQEFTALVDYAHKPDAVTAVLTALRPVTAGPADHRDRRRWRPRPRQAAADGRGRRDVRRPGRRHRRQPAQREPGGHPRRRARGRVRRSWRRDRGGRPPRRDRPRRRARAPRRHRGRGRQGSRAGSGDRRRRASVRRPRRCSAS